MTILSLYECETPKSEKLRLELCRSLESWQSLDQGQISPRAKGLHFPKKVKEFISTVPKISVSPEAMNQFLEQIESLPIIYGLVRTGFSIITII